MLDMPSSLGNSAILAWLDAPRSGVTCSDTFPGPPAPAPAGRTAALPALVDRPPPRTYTSHTPIRPSRERSHGRTLMTALARGVAPSPHSGR
jgi:hypothetical protein